MSQIQDQLQSHHSLLKLTAEWPKAIPESFSFQLANGTQIELWDTGVLCVSPAQPRDKAIVISSGVHGNETAPIEIVDYLVSQLLQQDIEVKQRTLFIIGNPVAMNLGQRFVEENMNRLFQGGHQGKQHDEAKRAEKLEQYVAQFFAAGQETDRYHYDLHTAIRESKYQKFAIYPYKQDGNYQLKQIQFLADSGIHTLLFGHAPSTTFSYYSSATHQAHAFTVELGKVKPFGENNMADFAGITENLKHLICGETIEDTNDNKQELKLFKVHHELIKKSDDFKLNLNKDVKNFDDFSQGYQLTEDVDGGYQTSQAGEAIVFPNENVPIGQRAGLVLVKTEL